MDIRDRLHGIFPPVVTNFDAVTGDIAPIPFRENLRRWIETPIDGVVLFGSNGEGALLDEDEKARLMGFARAVVPAGYPIIAGLSGESTRAAVREAKRLAAEGADVVLVHAPAYFGPHIPVGALLDYFRVIADESPVPVLLYHIPKYTHVTIEGGFIAELMRHPNVAGLKDSSGDIKRFADFTNACPKGCRIFVGNGALLYTALELGAVGGILGVANFAPQLCADIYRSFHEGNPGNAGRLQGRLTPLHKAIVAAHGGIGCKAALDLMGWSGGPPRAPLRPLSDGERQQVARVMQEAELL
ncbi:MAG TPA: dihydrodipicolinate synthase family protein [Longimicrobiales bacterium]|nr:dihydrodipicolinate synthase family protein [Longimicrobiales bacterium]